MRTIFQNTLFHVSLIAGSFFLAATGFCHSVNAQNTRLKPFLEVGSTLIETPNMHRGERYYWREHNSVMYTIEKSDAQWDLIFFYGGRLGNEPGEWYNNRLNYWLVEVYKNNEFIEKLHIKGKRYPPIAESRGRTVKIKIIPMHGNWYKLILYAQEKL